MTYDNLTNFDRHVLAQGESARYFAEPVRKPVDSFNTARVADRNKTDDELYDEYLINQLRRTTPSGKPVMKRDEFVAYLHENAYAPETTTYSAPAQQQEPAFSVSYSAPAFLGNMGSMTVEQVENRQETVDSYENPTTQKKAKKINLPKLTKLGKIILSVYVIMIAALASILIVTNTTVTDPGFHESANASVAVEEEENPSVIRAMTIEEEEETHGNWFDKLCDSLNN